MISSYGLRLSVAAGAGGSAREEPGTRAASHPWGPRTQRIGRAGRATTSACSKFRRSCSLHRRSGVAGSGVSGPAGPKLATMTISAGGEEDLEEASEFGVAIGHWERPSRQAL
eukprot:758178-Hanusia_phi.AAC.2